MINEVKLIGHAGADAKKKTFQNGNSIIELPLATSKSWKDKTTGEKKEKTTWHNLVFQSEFAESIRKGDLLYISGEIDNKTYEKDGVTYYRSEVRVITYRRLSKPEQATRPTTNSHEAEIETAPNDDLPF